jgi:hypothetical protein
MKEKDLDKETIDSYQAWVQWGIRQDLNSVALGPGKLPYRSGIFMLVCALGCFIVGILLVWLRMRHVYLWDWGAQFLGPFFFILFLLCMAGASYLFVIAKRRSNKYRSQLYFQPIGDWGVSCIHKSELALEEESKHELKSGTTPHKTVKPRAEAYSQSSKDARRPRQQQYRDGKDNRGYDKSPLDANKPFRPDGRRGPPPDGRRGPPPNGQRGPPPNGQRGPQPNGQRGPPPEGRRGPPPEGQRGPPPEGRRGPPPEGQRGPPPEGRRGPPPEGQRGPPPEGRRGPPPQERVHASPPDYEERGPNRRSLPDEIHRIVTTGQRVQQGRAVVDSESDSDYRPRGVPRFEGVERLTDEERQVRNKVNRSHDESDI